MKRKLLKRIKNLGRALMMCLCAVLLCSAAFTEKAETAEVPVDLGNTEGADRLIDFCTLPDGRVVFAGHTEKTDGSGRTAARLLCLNPDRTVCWDYTDPKLPSFNDIATAGNDTLAVFCDDYKVRFFTADGEPTGNTLSESAVYYGGLCYLTSFGMLWYNQADQKTQLTGWDGSVLFRADIPECMWSGAKPLEDGDGFVLSGQEAGDPATVHAKVMKIDLQGSTVWETVFPDLSEKRDATGARSVMTTSDGGSLAVVWDYRNIPGSDYDDGHSVLYKLDAGGQILWKNETEGTFWFMAEYDGKYVTNEQVMGTEADDRHMNFIWLDTDGNILGTTEYELRDDAYPPYADSGTASVSMEEFVPMKDGLWELWTFWEPDAADPDDEWPAWTQQDNTLVRVPEL